MTRAVRVAALFLVPGLLAGCGGLDGRSPTSTPQTPTQPPATHRPSRAPSPHPQDDSDRAPGSPAQDSLASLKVKGRAPLTGYSREAFGTPWVDVDDNGCDTRDDVLRRDLQSFHADDSCMVRSGQLLDPYTGRTIRFVEGGASEVDIDHVVSLGNAWQTGAFAWNGANRIAFANDPLNLLAVEAGANRQKGDGDAATWLPPNKPFRCAYVARQIGVKDQYQLWVTPPERAAMARILAKCPDGLRARSASPTSVAGPTDQRPTGPGSSRKPKESRSFGSCAQVQAAGVAPLRRGTRRYAVNRQLDGDGDGLACE